jgi:putative FmdB family regulatory protein
MPLFEYVCLECGAEFEKLIMKNTEADDISCPACNSRKLEEKFSSFSAASSNGSSSLSNCAPSGG